LLPLKRYYAPPDLFHYQLLTFYYKKFWKIKNPNILLVGGIINVSRETLVQQIFGHSKPVPELGVNLTMNYWGKRNLDHLVLNLCQFGGLGAPLDMSWIFIFFSYFFKFL